MTLSDSRNKEVALRRIKRLASSGLPLDPFVRGMLELINDAVPYSPNRSVLVGGRNRTEAFFASGQEVVSVLQAFREYFVDKPEISGAKYRQDSATLERILPSKIVWEHEELAIPDYERSEGFNAVMRPLDWHRVLQVVFQESGEFIGYAPLWRSANQKDFTRADAEFLRAAAPHITHGLRVAQLRERIQPKADDFAPLAGWGSGVVLMTASGKLIAMDATARAVFLQIGVLDGLRSDAFASKQMRAALEYVTRTLRQIFHEDENSPTKEAPVSQIFLHWTGIALRVRGVLMSAADGREYVTVLVERGETLENRRQRMIMRWGLSHRESEVLDFIAQGKTGREIAILLGISHDTTRKHTASIFQKIGVETRTSAATIAREWTIFGTPDRA